MSSDIQARLKRLRKAGRLSHRKKPRTPDAKKASPPPASTPAHDAPAGAGVACLTELAGMEEVAGERGDYLLRTVRYPLTHQQGKTCLNDLLALPEDAAFRLAEHPDFDFRSAIFLDTETSGLAGGAGTIVFLTGVGVFEEDGYVVRQFFARNPAEERAYLPDLARFIDERGGLITFNGRSFDWPLLRTRFILSDIEPPNEQPHVDLLHPARRLWRARLGACNFGNLEQRILGFYRSGLDIPSWMIPGMWFNFARGQGNVREMESVLYHNLEDIVSMAPLAHAIAGMLTGRLTPHPNDLPALAKAWQRAGEVENAERAYRQALDAPLPPVLREQALRELALLLKRSGRLQEAADLWQAWVMMNRPQDVEPLIELAKYHEWHTGDLAQARAHTQKALSLATTWRAGQRRSDAVARLQHRLARLERKLNSGR